MERKYKLPPEVMKLAQEAEAKLDRARNAPLPAMKNYRHFLLKRWSASRPSNYAKIGKVGLVTSLIALGVQSPLSYSIYPQVQGVRFE
jgi:hypothetical protein